MVRATTRSQKAPANSQPQARHGQSQRTRRRNNDLEAEQNVDEVVDGDGDGDLDIQDEHGGDVEVRRKACELVRLALFAEQRRTVLRREDVSKKVLGQNPRVFNRVFDRAQDILQKNFGMELAELQTRVGLETDSATQEEDRHATGMKKKAAAVGSKTYILRSVLHPAIIEHASLTDEQILEEEAADAPSDDDEDDESYTPKFYGSLISWSSADQLGALGILYTILALILVSGRVIADLELRAHLKRLSLPQTGIITFTAQSTHQTQSVEAYLSTLIRQGYLDRIQAGDSKGAKGKGGKRARMTQADEENGATYEWRWGSRSQSEVGEKAIAKFVTEFMVGDADDDEEEGARGRQGAGSKLERMMRGIERAAGGHLADVK